MVTTKRLARGVRLLSGHVVGQLKSLLDLFKFFQVAADNLENNKGTFRLNLHFPVMKGQDPGALQHAPMWVPFTLPPTQEYFESPPTSGVAADISGDYPRAVLREISVSFDQRAEAAAITRFYNSGVSTFDEGKLSFEELGRYSIKVSIYEKDMTYWRASSPLSPENKVAEFDLPSEAFTDDRWRLNPVSRGDLQVPINPLKSYLLEVEAPGLTDAVNNPLQINSLFISLKFEQGLVERDMNIGATLAVQNIPTVHNGEHTASSASIAEPVTASEPIYARTGGTGTGVQDATEAIDGLFTRLLRGGYNDRSGVTETSQIVTDSSYEVIAVPMFSNFGDVYNGLAAAVKPPNGQNIRFLPGEPAVSGACTDTRRVPIRFPFVLHHVVAAINWTPNALATNVTVPQDLNFQTEVGVGLGTGHYSEVSGWNQAAYGSWYPNTKLAHRIDSYNANDGSLQQNIGYELMEIPLVGSSVNSSIGTGFSATGVNGKPIFIGQSCSPTETRSDLAASVDGPAPVPRLLEGREQWIEVRMKLSDTVNQFGIGGLGAWKDTDIIIGNGGHWVFLIGKKQLA